ncbi:PIN domain-containing protein [Paenibacillus doosanensis]|uniref:PIN domain-containing protein n=1 Tax=Paenibacillus doosanensis TaxID=1229154 RepID=UPI00218002D8|nr:PIN domain-containing protein [Paenibacillus doosanensis]MCS7461228.1 PIN domain-containing protein [Paenibacillus doosanensis]
MKAVYLLDTNAFFNFIKNASLPLGENSNIATEEAVNTIKAGTCYISLISLVEIISVIGKYARGGGGANKKRMKPKVVKQWLKLVEDSTSGRSSLLSLSILPFSEKTIAEAQKIVHHALLHNFGSLDAIIAATAKECSSIKNNENTILITSDKGLKACLTKCEIPFWDAFQQNCS